MITKHDIAHKALTDTLTKKDVAEYYGNYEFDQEYIYLPGKTSREMFTEALYLKGLLDFVTDIMKDKGEN